MSVVTILGLLALAAAATAVVWKGSTWLESSANQLAVGYGVPAVVQGAIIAAAGSSMPELVSVLVATLLHGEFELGIGAIVGSAVFNLLVIPAGSALVTESDGGMETGRDLVYKEALFYMVAVATLLLTFSMAVIYNPSDGATLQGSFTRPLAVFPLGIYGLYVFSQYLDTADHEAEEDGTVQPRTWLWFGLGLVLIIVGVEGLVRAAIGLGDAFGTPAFLWGMTVVAAGSSIPDAFVSVAAARSGRPSVSLANVLGSNVFDLLVAVPLGVLVAGSLAITFPHVVPMMAFLIFATIVFFAIARTGMVLSEREAWLLLATYGLFVAWLVLESVGVTDVVRT
ncbi:sodium:calcium antiporter [Halobiforma lacisalsi AJ5]|uniref:Sodium/calcium exchanger membrane region n=1 Tax=Natronobacterium lacisalsi AJ5 TaxID=358396 RepID=M0LE29_NATLA|nr:sodium:calcium antiporter [Halobiforma lacisalsi]APW96417.1 sodium:calcium antiporter [Halobiforma lacisalsi AJ5]EMA31812.1 sodium/calcium exchanger membrane region [Halobiforma lacisalsi AJ5]